MLNNKTLCVVGAGSLGGFLCKELLKVKTIKALVCYDFDKVTEKNIEKQNTIYKKYHIGKLKVNCLSADILKDKRFIGIPYKYQEKNSEYYDLIIDCRDISYEGISYDIKLLILNPNESLVIDCLNEPKNYSYISSTYSFEIKADELYKASFVSRLSLQYFYPILKNNIVELDHNKIFSMKDKYDRILYLKREIEKQQVNDLDYIREEIPGEDKFVNIAAIEKKIVEENKNKDIIICYEGIPIEKIKKDSFTDSNSCVKILCEKVSDLNFSSFILRLSSNKLFITPFDGSA